MSIRISAIICTFNRADYLRKAIKSLVEQTLFKGEYEILVVDNASNDNTKKIVAQEFSHVENLRYLYEPILGLSQARNTGWRNARGAYVAYLDDDAIAYPDWLERILDVFRKVIPEPGSVGGKVEAIWKAPQPEWLSDRLLPFLTIVDWVPFPTILNDHQWLGGANIAFPRGLLGEVGGFQVELGRKGNRLLSMEELLLRQQLEKLGYRCYYDPEIAVRHHIPASRLTKRWFYRRLYWQGVSDAIALKWLDYQSIVRRRRMALSAARIILTSSRSITGLLLRTNDPDRFAQKCKTLEAIGYIFGLLGLAR